MVKHEAAVAVESEKGWESRREQNEPKNTRSPSFHSSVMYFYNVDEEARSEWKI